MWALCQYLAAQLDDILRLKVTKMKQFSVSAAINYRNDNESCRLEFRQEQAMRVLTNVQSVIEPHLEHIVLMQDEFLCSYESSH